MVNIRIHKNPATNLFMPVSSKKTLFFQQSERVISHKTALIILLVVHFFGILGLIYLSTRPYFEMATPVNLLLTFVLLFYFHKDWNKAFLAFALSTYLIGFLVEVAGVHTSLIFGSYAYGDSLGPKLWEVPLIIGINWLVLTYASGVVSTALTSNKLIGILVGSLLMVGLDFLIEPVAIVLDFGVGQTMKFLYKIL